MIDGVKIKAQSIKAAQWLDHEGLDFALSVSNKTGEILKGKPLLAECDGLTFRMTPTQKDPNEYSYHVLGSLSKYHNKGTNNKQDFSLSDVADVVKDLEKYHIDPSVSYLETVELGVNVVLPYPCKRVFDALVTMPLKPFAELRFEKMNIGKRCDFQEYEVKVYDKGKATKGKESNLLRVELRVKKMQYLERTGVKTLSDLTDKTKVAKMAQLLLKSVGNVIMCDFDFQKLDTLTPSVKENVLKWTNPKMWQAWNKDQRYKNLKALKSFEIETQTGTVKTDLLAALTEKMGAMLGEPIITIEKPKVIIEPKTTPKTPKLESGFVGKKSQIGKRFVPKLESGFIGKSDVLSIKINGYFVAPKKDNNIGGAEKGGSGGKTKTAISGRVCCNCQTDIDHKRPQTVFCSVRCKNQISNSKNNPLRQRRKKGEKPPQPMQPQTPPTENVTPSVPTPQNVQRAVAFDAPKTGLTPSVPIESFDIRAALVDLAQNWGGNSVAKPKIDT